MSLFILLFASSFSIRLCFITSGGYYYPHVVYQLCSHDGRHISETTMFYYRDMVFTENGRVGSMFRSVKLVCLFKNETEILDIS